MTLYLAIDPGPVHSGLVVLDVIEHETCVDVSLVCTESSLDNEEIQKLLCAWDRDQVRFEIVSIETIRHSYGTRVGRDVLDTAWWSGRMHEASLRLMSEGGSVLRTNRMAVVQSAKQYAAALDAEPPKGQTADAQVRAAMIAIFGGRSAIGTKRAPGPLHGVTSHAWQALAVGIHTILARYAKGIRPVPRRSVTCGAWGLGTSLAISGQHEAV